MFLIWGIQTGPLVDYQNNFVSKFPISTKHESAQSHATVKGNYKFDFSIIWYYQASSDLGGIQTGPSAGYKTEFV